MTGDKLWWWSTSSLRVDAIRYVDKWRWRRRRRSWRQGQTMKTMKKRLCVENTGAKSAGWMCSLDRAEDLFNVMLR